MFSISVVGKFIVVEKITETLGNKRKSLHFIEEYNAMAALRLSDSNIRRFKRKIAKICLDLVS